MEFLNEAVKPAVLIKHTSSPSSKYYGKTRYFDPEDNAAFDPKKLTAPERGHFYDWYHATDGWTYVGTPLRVFDRENGNLLSAIASFELCTPAKVAVIAPRTRKNARMGLQSFRVTTADFSEFERLAGREGWVLRDAKTDTAELGNLINDRSAEAMLALESCRQFRVLLADANILGPERFSALEETIEGLRAEASRIISQQLDVSRRVSQLYREMGRGVQAALMGEALIDLTNIIESLRAIDWQRVSRELVHRYKVCLGEDTSAVDLRGPLHLEIGYLKTLYPVLHCVTVVSNSEVHLSLGGVDLTLREDGEYSVDSGDVYALAKGAAKREGTPGSRFTAVAMDEG